MDIVVYKAELECGIGDLIRSTNKVAHLVEFKEIAPFELPQSLQLQLKSAEDKGETRTSFDLYYLQSLLVSSVWNENDEYFKPAELWAARNTAKDKPFNYEHECDDIIGHTINGYVIDNDGKILDDNTVIDDLPDTIHIISNAVVYKYWDKEDKQSRMKKLLAEIKDGSWYVSAECLFPSFDYALRSDDGHAKLVARNESTAFLTKYLKVYGGSGLYNNERIARVPTNFIISGKGLVSNPANKVSKIFAKKYELSKNQISPAYQILEVNKMNEQEYKANITKLETRLQESVDAYNKLKASLDEGKSKELQAKIDSLMQEAEARSQEVTMLKASVEKVSADKVAIDKQLETVNAEKKALAETLNKIEATKKETDRVNLCKNKLSLTDDEAKNFANSLNALSDDNFNAFVEFQSKFISKSGKVETKVETDTKVLDDVKKDDKAVDLNVSKNTADKTKAICEQVANYMKASGYAKVAEKSKFEK